MIKNMATGLPYFKFIPADWLIGNIVYEDLCTQGLFINICALYWQRDGALTVSEVNKRYRNPELLNSLIGEFISVKNDKISIKFLDKQLITAEHISKKNKLNGSKGGRPKNNPNKSESHNNMEDNDLQKPSGLIWVNSENPNENQTKPKKSQYKEEIKKNKSKEEVNKIKENNNSLIFTEMVKIWMDWFEFENSVPPKFTAVDGAKIKSIQKYLEMVISKKGELTDQKIFDAWSLILETVPKHDFVYKNLSLAIIDQKINELISLASNKNKDRASKHDESTAGALRILQEQQIGKNEVSGLE